jgi:RNA polymerase sigma-70 factor (ECF subfamily)
MNEGCAATSSGEIAVMGSTSATLLGHLRDLSDAWAWQEFEARYRPRVLAWCMRKGLQAADAEDVTQDVLLRVTRALPRYDYLPGSNFSGWLYRIWHNAWVDFVTDRTPGGRGTGDTSLHEQLQHVAAGDLAAELRAEFERELFHEALARVQPRVSPRDWSIFTDLVFAGQPAAAVAAAQRMTLAAVGVVKFRVQQKLKAEIAQLEGDDSKP